MGFSKYLVALSVRPVLSKMFASGHTYLFKLMKIKLNLEIQFLVTVATFQVLIRTFPGLQKVQQAELPYPLAVFSKIFPV